MIVTGNKGEWAEVAAKCHYIINGSFPDGLTGKLQPFDAMWDGHENGKIKPMAADPARYPAISQRSAQEMLERGIDLIARSGGPTFLNPPLHDLCVHLGIKQMKATSRQKPDIILYNDKAAAAYFIENPGSSLASFVNASKTTRITYRIIRPSGEALSVADRKSVLDRYGQSVLDDGHRRVKKRVQQMRNVGLKFEYHSIADDGFRSNTQDIPWSELGCLCIDYLSGWGVRSVGDVFDIHKEHTNERTFKHTREAFLAYVRNCILERGPSRDRDDPEVLCEGQGMIFLIILEKGVFRLYKAANPYWWDKEIELGAYFDTPDSDRHDYGYAYPSVEGELLFDYALGIRGTFKDMIDKEE